MSIALTLSFSFACSGRERGGNVVAMDDPSNKPDASDNLSPDGNTSPPPEDVLVYAHSRDTLYSFSPTNLAVSEVGPFTIAGGGETEDMLDLAVDGEGTMYTVGRTTLFSVDPETAVATAIGQLQGVGEVEITALAVLAEGVLGSEEVLVGADNTGSIFKIDRATAVASPIGKYPDGWMSSGDIVSIEDLGTFGTVRKMGIAGDSLVRIHFAGGAISGVEVIGPIDSDDEAFEKLFGIGYWGDSLYGFMGDGRFVRIDIETATAAVVTAATGAEEFWGAGVTTKAPVVL